VQLYKVDSASLSTSGTSASHLEPIIQLDGPSDIEWIDWHPKGGSVLLAGSSDGTVWMWFVSTGKCMQVFVGHEEAVTAGAFTDDGRWALSCSLDGTLRIWNPKTGVARHTFRNAPGERFTDAPIICMDTHSELAVVGAEDGSAWVVHLKNKKVLTHLKHSESQTSVEAVGFAPAQINPNWVATGGLDGNLKIWDLTNNSCRQTCHHGEQSGITQLRWHPYKPQIYTSAADGSIRLWDARSGQLLKTLSGHTDQINGVDTIFHTSPTDPDIIASCSDDQTVRIFAYSSP